MNIENTNLFSRISLFNEKFNVFMDNNNVINFIKHIMGLFMGILFLSCLIIPFYSVTVITVSGFVFTGIYKYIYWWVLSFFFFVAGYFLSKEK